MSKRLKYGDKSIVIAALLVWLCLLFLPMLTAAATGIFLLCCLLFRNPVRNSRSLWIACIFFVLSFILLLLQFPFAADKQAQWFETEKKMSFLVLPLCFLLYRWTAAMQRQLLQGYLALVAAAGVICLLYAGWVYGNTGDATVFYYHRLGAFLELHAVYFSLYICLASACLVFMPDLVPLQSLRLGLKLFLLLLILLLSSKLFLVLQLFLYGTDLLRRGQWYRRYWWVFLLPVPVLFLLSRLPVAERFRDIRLERTSLIRQQQLADSVYLDGLSFRLLQWKNGLEILEEHNAWLSGLPSGDASACYRQKIRDKKWYTGTDGQSGYLQYNMHNQYLETWIRSGLAGLLLLTGLLLLLFYTAWKTGSALLLSLFLLFAFFFCTESVLERQAGVLPFCFTLLLGLSGVTASRFPERDHTLMPNGS